MRLRYCLIAGLALLAAACHGKSEKAQAPVVSTAIAGYDADSDLASTDAAPQQTPQRVLQGSYAPEGAPGARGAWIGRGAKLSINEPVAGRNLLVTGWAPYSLHHKAGLQGPLTVSVRVNGAEVATRSFIDDEMFEIKVANPALGLAAGSGGATTVEVVPSHSFIPKQSLGSADSRELSIMLKKVQLIP